jgi:hypothetical protein
MKQIRISISPEGNFKHIYSDELLPMDKKFKTEVRRASDVFFDNDIGQWRIRVGNLLLDETFDRRDQALSFEVRWLESNALHG